MKLECLEIMAAPPVSVFEGRAPRELCQNMRNHLLRYRKAAFLWPLDGEVYLKPAPLILQTTPKLARRFLCLDRTACRVGAGERIRQGIGPSLSLRI